MEGLITALMKNHYWDVLKIDSELPFENACLVEHIADHRAPDTLKNELLLLAMMGFYPLSYSILSAFRQIETLAPNDEVRKKAEFFVEVEEGKHAASDWYRGVHHSELYRRMWSSLASVEIMVDKEMLEHYLLALQLEQGGLPRALVTAAFIEKTGLGVLHMLHDFVARWQVYTQKQTRNVDLTYLNEHMLHEGDGSADQHVCIIDQLIRECGTMDVQREIEHFQFVTDAWLTHIYERIGAVGNTSYSA